MLNPQPTTHPLRLFILQLCQHLDRIDDGTGDWDDVTRTVNGLWLATVQAAEPHATPSAWNGEGGKIDTQEPHATPSA